MIFLAIDLFNKYAWVVPLKDYKRASIVNAFQKVLTSSKRKPNKIRGDQGSEFYSKAFKRQSHRNAFNM